MQKDQLRKADLKTSIIIILIACYMIYTSLGYPLTDSYAGIDNKWYVSPALFPLLIASMLLVCGFALLRNALIYAKKHNQLPGFLRFWQGTISETTIKTVVILLFLCAYVYGLIPRVDFVLASSIFLFAFIVAFYIKVDTITWGCTRYFALGSLLVLLQDVIFNNEEHAGHATLASDLLTIGIGIWLTVWCYHQSRSNKHVRRQLKIALIVSVAVSLVLGVVFRFGLLIPLPSEGSVMEALHTLRYWIREA